MSKHLLGVPYATVDQLIYPHPPYKTFTIKKRSGAPRTIREPRQTLKNLQLKVLAFLEARAGKPKPCVHAFTRGRSIVTNALRHCSPQTQHLLNIDLEEFFPSITFYRVRGLLRARPFECSHQVATVLAHLCTYQNSLPQGAPTSPMLANLVCRSLDRDLMDLARRHRSTYTRYADDMTFSFSVRDSSKLPANICSFDTGVLGLGHELIAIIERHSFRINPAKSRMSTRLHRLEVTGITINEFPNVKRAFIDRIRGALHAWDAHGITLAQAEWEHKVMIGLSDAYEKRPWKRQRRDRRIPKLVKVLWGKLLYVRMVRGADDVIYTRLAERFNVLGAREHALDSTFMYEGLPIEPIVRNSDDVERAVFVIEWAGDYLPPGAADTEMIGGQGTAFAYKVRNRLITCDHVLNWSGEIDGASVSINCMSPEVTGLSLTVRNPSLGTAWPVRIIHRDAARDLALLEFIGTPPHRYFSGMDAPIKLNEPGVLIGFPNWSPGRPANQLTSTVLSHFPRSGLQRFEIAGNIRQGNSGGPFVDALYRVSGVAQQGARQDGGNDECLCVSELNAWLEAYDASLVSVRTGSVPLRTPAAPISP